MKKSHLLVFILFLAPILLIVLNDRKINSEITDNITFKQRLSEYNLYQGDISKLIPTKEAVTIEIASPLFTDYTQKQRIILLPAGQKMKEKGSGLPDFPDGTIIAKTFFYATNNTANGKHIIETRLLIKKQGQWNASTYQWNDKQDEAFLLQDGATVPVHLFDEEEKYRTTDYKIPSKADCISCHRVNDQILPIGPKLRNMNFNIKQEANLVNQLEFLKEKGKLEINDIATIIRSVDYRDEKESLQMRAKSYLDINCAHCHNPNGTAYITQLDLRMETPTNETGIWFKQGKIAYRMTVTGDLHMPKIGATLTHDEGVKLIINYIKNLK